MEKVLVVIDDSPEQESVAHSIADHLNKDVNMNVLPLYANPNSRAYLDKSKDPVLDKLIEDIKTRLTGLRPSLIVVDMYYSDNEIFDGLDVLTKLRDIPKCRRSNAFLISGKRNKIIREVFQRTEDTEDEKIKKLDNIVSLGVDRFLDKNFKHEAIEVLKRIDIKEVIISKLLQFENDDSRIVNLFSPKFRTISLEDIANKIETNHADSPEIIGELVDQTLAHYLRIDERL